MMIGRVKILLVLFSYLVFCVFYVCVLSFCNSRVVSLFRFGVVVFLCLIVLYFFLCVCYGF